MFKIQNDLLNNTYNEFKWNYVFNQDESVSFILFYIYIK